MTWEESVGPSPIAEELQSLRRQLHDREEQLAERPVIDQAKGMLMQDFGVSAPDATALLASLAQDSSLEVQEVAERLVRRLRGTASGDTAERTAHKIEQLRELLGDPQQLGG
ncbi:MAG TPA: ANTAR domain-containing protein [Segeticoccus sp.]|jgi:hypothetical protein|nr:ANTAR domain-containing protein [Segeticoccus sp.]